MIIQELYLKNFRCFKEQRIQFEEMVTFLHGPNGSGKTSIIEALYFLGYLHSWRTSTPRDLCLFESDHFFIKLKGQTREEHWNLQVGLQGNKRLVKFGENTIKSFREISDHYQLIVLSEDDLSIIEGGPEERRAFIDNALCLQNPGYKSLLKNYRQILTQRNGLLGLPSIEPTSYDIWSAKLWELATIINHERAAYVEQLNDAVMQILTNTTFFKSCPIQLIAKEVRFSLTSSYSAFSAQNSRLLDYERKAQRTLWGPHLDDYVPLYNGSHARQFASRGQKKRMVTLLKLAQAHTLGRKPIWALDDFMADFDDESASTVFELVNTYASQLIIASPSQHAFSQCIKPTNTIGYIKIS